MAGVAFDVSYAAADVKRGQPFAQPRKTAKPAPPPKPPTAGRRPSSYRVDRDWRRQLDKWNGHAAVRRHKRLAGPNR